MERSTASISVLRNINILSNFQTPSLNLRARLKQMGSFSLNNGPNKEPQLLVSTFDVFKFRTLNASAS